MQAAYELADPFEVIEQAQKSLIDLTLSVSGGGPIGLNEALRDLNSRIEAGMRGEIKGYKIGLDRYDRITGGWMDGDLIVIAGRPGMGKSAMLGPIIDSAFAQKKKIAVFLLEMPTVQLAARLVSPIVETSSKNLLLGNTPNNIFQKLNYAYREICHGTFDEHVFIDDQSTSIRDISVKSRRLKSKHGLDLIAIDYLQLLSIPGFKGNREQEVSSISRSCKMLAKELGVPVVVFAQLSRAVEQTSDKIPTLAHLRESGAIEQDADLVTFLWRPWYYFEQTREPKFQEVEDSAGRMIPTDQYAAAFIAKHRNGALGTADLGFIPKYAKFTNYEDLYPTLYQGHAGDFSPSVVPHPDAYHDPRADILSFE
jgi:replicative DNA helicase